MSIAQRKAMIDRHDGVSLSRQCKLAGIRRSTFYYKPLPVDEQELSMMVELDRLYTVDPTRGTRRMCNELNKLGFAVGRDHTRRLMQHMRLKTVYCRPRTTVITPGDYKFPYLLRNLAVVRKNQVWAVDISYVPMHRGYMYLFVIMDVYSRYIVGWSVSNTMETGWIIQTIQRAIDRYGIPEIINSDQGSQFTSEEYVNYVKDLKTCQISMDGKGRAIDNVFVERFFRTIKHEKLYLTVLATGHQVNQACSEFIEYYNCQRDHSSLHNKTPQNVYLSAA